MVAKYWLRTTPDVILKFQLHLRSRLVLSSEMHWYAAKTGKISTVGWVPGTFLLLLMGLHKTTTLHKRQMGVFSVYDSAYNGLVSNGHEWTISLPSTRTRMT
jgi:hypothetical protein